MSLFSELKRRNVIRVGAAYIVAAWLVIQVVETVFPAFGFGDATVRLVTIFFAIGLIPALVLSWAFEVTPEGLKKEKDVDRSQSITAHSGKKLDRMIMVVLALALGYFAFDKFVLSESREASIAEEARHEGRSEALVDSYGDRSIAVLPFVALSSGEDDGYFADGLTEEILNALTQLPELQVTARTSSFFFKGQNIPVPEIATRLDVAHIVEGSVRRESGRVRITAQLIRAADGFHLWSQSYDRTLDDVFAVQEDIAENIAEALDVLLDDDARRIMRSAGIGDVEAFIAYQKGLEAFATAHHHLRFISEPLAIASAYFDQALVAAPGLVEARVWKADQVTHIIFEIAARIRDEKYPGEAQEALATLWEEYDLAVQLSPPGNQRDILDLERTLFSDDWYGIPGRIKKAMQPGECPQINWTNEFIAPFGWAEQLAEKARETLACDPMHSFASVNLSRSLIWTGDPAAALQAAAEAANKGISFAWLEDVRYWALLAAGHLNDPALRGPGPKGSLILYDRQILLEALAGDPAMARQMAEEYWSRPDADDWSSLMVAAVVGDRERANKIAARIDGHPGSAVVFGWAIMDCFCGAPFDLEATPNYKSRIEEAGFPWPPPKRIDYPTKTW